MNVNGFSLGPSEPSAEDIERLDRVRAQMARDAERERQTALARVAAERAAAAELRGRQTARVPDSNILIDLLARAREIEADYEQRFATHVNRSLALKAAVATMIDLSTDAVVLLRQVQQMETDDRNVVMGYTQFDASQMLDALLAVSVARSREARS